MLIVFLCFYLIEFNQSYKLNTNETMDNKTSFSINSLMELNNLLKQEIFISNITLTKNLLAIIKFNFSPNFKNLIQLYKLNQVEINVKHVDKCSLCSSNQYFTKTLNLTLNNSLFQNFCTSEKNEAGNCYSSNSNLSSSEWILNTLSFRLNNTGSFFVCIKFIRNPNLIIFTDNMCYNWKAENHNQLVENHSFRYKPLFILLMYVLCASILIPIAIFQHFVTNSKSKLKIKIDAPSNCDFSDTSNNGLTKDSHADLKIENPNNNLLSPLIQPFHEKTKEQFHYKEIDENFQIEIDAEIFHEAHHILDNKPWMEKMDSVPDNNSVHLPNSSELKDTQKIKLSGSNLNSYFESNV